VVNASTENTFIVSMIKAFLPQNDELGDNFRNERYLYSMGFLCVAGCDEAGRGPLAGPVVAACVHLPQICDHSVFLDSKILSEKKRLLLYTHLQEIGADIGIGAASERDIERINILQASLLAMKRAIADMPNGNADFVLVDGKFTVPVNLPQAALIKGESKSCSIAAASIVAKVERDKIMTKLHEKYPVYNFSQHKGYPTRQHRQAIAENGPCKSHRRTFKGVKEFVK
jgi:ribonuclease HII